MTTATLSTAEPEPAATTATGIESSIPAQTEPAETAPDKPMPALVVFGTDKDGKPHASAFTESDAALASKAAGVMDMRVMVIESDEHRALAAALPAGRRFDRFDPEDDPYGEHDFGAVEVGGERFFWKIDTYDRAMLGHSPDPADPSVTTRVLMIMRADEY